MLDDEKLKLYSRPENLSEIDGAVTFEGGALCWNGKSMAWWSMDSGWTNLPSPGFEIAKGFVCDKGVILSNEKMTQIALWPYGARFLQWKSVLVNDPSFFNYSLFVSADYILLARNNFGSAKSFFFKIGTNGPENLCELEGPGAVAAAWVDGPHPKNDLLYVLSDCGVFTVKPESQAPCFKCEKHLNKPDFQWELIDGLVFESQKSIFFKCRLDDQFAWCMDKKSLATHLTSLGVVDGGSRKLFATYDDKNIPVAMQMIGLLVQIPEPVLSFDWKRMDIVLNNDAPVGVVTSSGIYCPEQITPLDRETFEAAFSMKEKLIPWLFWANWEHAQDLALDFVLNLGLEDDLLIETLKHYYGPGVCKKLFEHVIGKPLPDEGCFFGQRIQKLFSRFGNSVAELVKKKLVASDPFALLIACIASGAVDSQNEEPVLWNDQYPPPRSELIALLSRPEPIIRVSAAEAIGALRLPGAANAILDVLLCMKGDHAISKREIINALSRLPDPTLEVHETVENMALQDRGPHVREAAVRALASLFRGRETINVLIRAMGDLSFFPRSEVDDALVAHMKRFNYRDACRMTDRLVLNILTDKICKSDPNSFLEADFIQDVMEELDENFDNDIEKLKGLEKSTREAFGDMFFIYLFLYIFLSGERMDLEDEDKINEFDQFVLAAYDSPIAEMKDFRALLAGRGKEKAGLEFAMKILESRPELGSRLLLIIYAGLSRDKIAALTSPTEQDSASDNYQPLHLRLRRASKKTTPMDACLKQVRELSRKEDIGGCTVLFAMAEKGEGQALNVLRQRLVDGYYAEQCPLLLYACYCLLSENEQMHFVSNIMGAGQIHINIRTSFLDEIGIQIGEREDLFVFEDLRRFYIDLVHSPDIGFNDKLGAARRLNFFGEPEYLENFWHEAEAEGLVSEDNRFDFACDMAILGDERHMDFVRSAWEESHNLYALHAFARQGEPEDIAALESALKKGAPEDKINETIAAIRKRHGITTTEFKN